MKTWEMRREEGLAAARAALAEAGNHDGIASAFSEWWHTSLEFIDGDSRRTQKHPPAEQLANALRAAGLEEAANFATDDWIKTGSIDPGLWTVSLLLGASFVNPFIETLKAGRFETPMFFGLENSGAWDAFTQGLEHRLEADPTACDAALQLLKTSVTEMNTTPGNWLEHDRHDRGRLRDRIKEYQTSPTISEVWEKPFDPPVWPDEYVLWETLLVLRPDDTLALIGEMPHPVFMRACLPSPRHLPEPQLISNLIEKAPPAFDQTGRFLATGGAVMALLELARLVIAETALDDDGWLRSVPRDRSEELGPACEQLHKAKDIIVDGLFSRPDASALSWPWLEHIVSMGHPRTRTTTEPTATLDVPTSTVMAVARHLEWRSDANDWIEGGGQYSKFQRLAVTAAVGINGQKPGKERVAKLFERALTLGDLTYPGIEHSVSHGQDAVATLCGKALCALESGADLFYALWLKLRPIRERNWRIDYPQRNNVAEILILFGISALSQLPGEQQNDFWRSIERSLRDAWQTDRFGHAPALRIMLIRLFHLFRPPQSAGSETAEIQFRNALLPYIAADYGFLTSVIALNDLGQPIQAIRAAIAAAGFDLASLAQQFLDMKKRVFALPQANKVEIEKFRELAKLDTVP